MARRIAGGNIWDLGSLASYETQFAEGDYGFLNLELRAFPGQTVIDALQSAITMAGVTLTRPIEAKGGSCNLRIHFQKQLAPLAIFAIIIGSAFAIAALLMSWGLYQKMSEMDTGTFSWQIVLLIAVGIVAFVVVVIMVARKGRFKLSKAGAEVGK